MRSLRVAFSFFTVFPVARTASVEEIAGSCFCAPLVAAVIGVAAGAAGWAGVELFGAPTAAALALALSLLLTGFHHTDGLADFGDALMARGNRRRRIEVLKDRTMGTGAVGALLLVYLLTWTALFQLLGVVSGARIIWYVVAAELAARLALLINAAISPASHPGSGSIFLAAAHGWRGIIGIAAALGGLLLIMIPLTTSGPLLAAGAAVLIAVIVSLIGRSWFGGVGGDLLGATVELGRLAALMALAAALKAWPPA